MQNYKGLKWYKCDFHLHTSGSECFEDKTITADEWVKEAINKELDCVAVTDHNTGSNIDEIIERAKETSLTVFPGVEITCDTSKIHLLILFDVNKGSQDVNDFLIKCDIDRDKFGINSDYKGDKVEGTAYEPLATMCDLSQLLLIDGIFLLVKSFHFNLATF